MKGRTSEDNSLISQANRRSCAVDAIAKDRHPSTRKMNPDLVGATRQEIEGESADPACKRNRPHNRLHGASVRSNRVQPRPSWIAADGLVDQAILCTAFNEGDITLLHTPHPERSRELRRDRGTPRKRYNPGRATIQAMKGEERTIASPLKDLDE